jgi:hypothetical protein
MDVNPVKPVPIIQPARKVQRESHERDHPSQAKKRTRDDEDDGSKRIDTYA